MEELLKYLIENDLCPGQLNIKGLNNSAEDCFLYDENQDVCNECRKEAVKRYQQQLKDEFDEYNIFHLIHGE
ncbi:MAG: hypothetical protein GX660_12715 [Clostridiaceae bacterium]|nr:hypothetical protein [Clostridiaceae bacterium]